MYTPPAYAETDEVLLRARMREWSFATLVTHGENGLNATHLPFLVDEEGPGGSHSAHGLLTTHLARGNAQYRDLKAGAPALVIFQGPHAFISPSWYEHRLTFPTWNYTAIHVHGAPEVVEGTDAIHAVLQRTVATYDTPLGGDWSFPGVPADYTALRLKAIAAVRIPIARIEGKMKLNQDKSVADRLGVIAALERQGDAQSLAVAELIRQQPGLAAAPNA
ncbi:negative transcriptional regulator, PaiB family [Variovorax sp. OK605]|uniref:FMN-binding negative transcriptional regulator n=1 Tax=Variovorax sp. OK605 TaxID=1855317 RepID=UPI0008F40E63|nr:FMN-binding negative transcriptional regulator [Variovorax sp. OK605]SFP83479.1 negative transcriptional regulator, PaiB family [Variovorax sp. OK605]